MSSNKQAFAPNPSPTLLTALVQHSSDQR